MANIINKKASILEAAKCIDTKDYATVTELTKKFPIAMGWIMKMLTANPQLLLEIAKMLDGKINVMKLNNMAKSNLLGGKNEADEDDDDDEAEDDDDDEEDEEEEEKKPAKKFSKKQEDEEDEEDEEEDEEDDDDWDL